jgi:hypothetical protein
MVHHQEKINSIFTTLFACNNAQFLYNIPVIWHQKNKEIIL